MSRFPTPIWVALWNLAPVPSKTCLPLVEVFGSGLDIVHCQGTFRQSPECVHHIASGEAGILDDGSLDHPMPMDSTLAEGADSAFPFLMPDGVTLYFANNGGNSLGGYDIFMTRRSDDADGRSYMQPQNIGMPYNSPYDDYMLAIDAQRISLRFWGMYAGAIRSACSAVIRSTASGGSMRPAASLSR